MRIFFVPPKLDEEFKNVIDWSICFHVSGFDNFTAQVSVRDLEKPEKYIGSVENWEKSEQAIINAAKDKGLNCCSVWRGCLWSEIGFYGKGCTGKATTGNYSS